MPVEEVRRRRRRPRPVEEDEVEAPVVKKSRSGKRRAPVLPRMSVTLPAKLRKLVRIAAAKADLEVGEWCKVVLTEAANRTYRKYYPDEEEDE